jgi:hypothetical protein
MSASAGWCFSPLARVFLRSIKWIAIVRDSLCEAVERAGPKLGPRSILEESVNGALQSFPNDLGPGISQSCHSDGSNRGIKSHASWSPVYHLGGPVRPADETGEGVP